MNKEELKEFLTEFNKTGRKSSMPKNAASAWATLLVHSVTDKDLAEPVDMYNLYWKFYDSMKKKSQYTEASRYVECDRLDEALTKYFTDNNIKFETYQDGELRQHRTTSA